MELHMKIETTQMEAPQQRISLDAFPSRDKVSA